MPATKGDTGRDTDDDDDIFTHAPLRRAKKGKNLSQASSVSSRSGRQQTTQRSSGRAGAGGPSAGIPQNGGRSVWTDTKSCKVNRPPANKNSREHTGDSHDKPSRNSLKTSEWSWSQNEKVSCCHHDRRTNECSKSKPTGTTSSSSSLTSGMSRIHTPTMSMGRSTSLKRKHDEFESASSSSTSTGRQRADATSSESASKMNEFCPICQVPFAAVYQHSRTFPEEHVQQCIEVDIVDHSREECPDADTCTSTIPQHFQKYSHCILACHRAMTVDSEHSQVETSTLEGEDVQEEDLSSDGSKEIYSPAKKLKPSSSTDEVATPTRKDYRLEVQGNRVLCTPIQDEECNVKRESAPQAKKPKNTARKSCKGVIRDQRSRNSIQVKDIDKEEHEKKRPKTKDESNSAHCSAHPRRSQQVTSVKENRSRLTNSDSEDDAFEKSGHREPGDCERPSTDYRTKSRLSLTAKRKMKMSQTETKGSTPNTKQMTPSTPTSGKRGQKRTRDDIHNTRTLHHYFSPSQKSHHASTCAAEDRGNAFGGSSPVPSSSSSLTYIPPSKVAKCMDDTVDNPVCTEDEEEPYDSDVDIFLVDSDQSSPLCQSVKAEQTSKSVDSASEDMENESVLIGGGVTKLQQHPGKEKTKAGKHTAIKLDKPADLGRNSPSFDLLSGSNDLCSESEESESLLVVAGAKNDTKLPEEHEDACVEDGSRSASAASCAVPIPPTSLSDSLELSEELPAYPLSTKTSGDSSNQLPEACRDETETECQVYDRRDDDTQCGKSPGESSAQIQVQNPKENQESNASHPHGHEDAAKSDNDADLHSTWTKKIGTASDAAQSFDLSPSRLTTKGSQSSSQESSKRRKQGTLDAFFGCKPAPRVEPPQDTKPKRSRRGQASFSQQAEPRNQGEKEWVNVSGRACPFYKKMTGTSFTVDAFSFGVIHNCTAYFLSHFHYDHYRGLSKHFNQKLFCSKVTGNLVLSRIKVREQHINRLPMNNPVVIDDVEVTLLDANHCPGSVMFLFKLRTGATYLHTGDFRADAKMEEYPELVGCHVNQLYLDTTYCDPQYTFPSQQDVIRFAVTTAEKAVRQNRRTLIVCGTYTIGKEKVFKAIARALRCKVYVTGEKMKVYECLDDQELASILTRDRDATQLHVVNMNIFSHSKLKGYLSQFGPRYDNILAFKPTGWTHSSKTVSPSDIKPSKKGNSCMYGIPYSEHSSYSEMKRFVQFLRADRILPTVNNGDPRARKEMESIFSKWMKECRDGGGGGRGQGGGGGGKGPLGGCQGQYRGGDEARGKEVRGGGGGAEGSGRGGKGSFEWGGGGGGGGGRGGGGVVDDGRGVGQGGGDGGGGGGDGRGNGQGGGDGGGGRGVVGGDGGGGSGQGVRGGFGGGDKGPIGGSRGQKDGGDETQVIGQGEQRGVLVVDGEGKGGKEPFERDGIWQGGSDVDDDGKRSGQGVGEDEGKLGGGLGQKGGGGDEAIGIEQEVGRVGVEGAGKVGKEPFERRRVGQEGGDDSGGGGGGGDDGKGSGQGVEGELGEKGDEAKLRASLGQEGGGNEARGIGQGEGRGIVEGVQKAGEEPFERRRVGQEAGGNGDGGGDDRKGDGQGVGGRLGEGGDDGKLGVSLVQKGGGYRAKGIGEQEKGKGGVEGTVKGDEKPFEKGEVGQGGGGDGGDEKESGQGVGEGLGEGIDEGKLGKSQGQKSEGYEAVGIGGQEKGRGGVEGTVKGDEKPFERGEVGQGGGGDDDDDDDIEGSGQGVAGGWGGGDSKGPLTGSQGQKGGGEETIGIRGQGGGKGGELPNESGGVGPGGGGQGGADSAGGGGGGCGNDGRGSEDGNISDGGGNDGGGRLGGQGGGIGGGGEQEE
ncbi:uncharacterized protein [Diadema antillarum]|uniref:uncharacterized protein n=1 Tax=Diadema antillarum TaxID=105358 RepID=UPI003A8A0223